MKRAAPDTRTRLVDAALFLFWRNGYAATGMAEILARSKVNSGSFYYFFQSKEELLLAVLDLYIASLDAVITGPVFAKHSDPIDRIFGILAFYRQNLIKTNCTYGCPIGRLALEIPEERAAVHGRLATNFENWTIVIENCLNDMGDRLPRDLDRKALSQFVLTVMEGGVMQSRAHRSLEPFDASVEQLRNYFRLLTKQLTKKRQPAKTLASTKGHT